MMVYMLLLSVLPVVVAAEVRGPTPSISRTVLNYYASSRRWMAAFGNPKYFTDKCIPADKEGVMLKVPNFDLMFDEIMKVSPLAKQALTEDKPGGIKAIDDSADVYKWRVTDNNPQRLVSHIDKIDNFQKKGVPIVRLRSTLKGPTKKRAECFGELISSVELRSKYDPTCAIVDTIYSAANLKEVEELQLSKYGKPSLFGIGYVKTKQSVVSPREQLTLCCLQNLPSGASVLIGFELPEDQNHLFPEASHSARTPRSTSHIFATTLIPTGEDTFDVEYVLQIEIGGFPGWLTGPIVIETVKRMFAFADGYFKSGFDEGGDLWKRLALFPDEEETVNGDKEVEDDFMGRVEKEAQAALEKFTEWEGGLEKKAQAALEQFTEWEDGLEKEAQEAVETFTSTFGVSSEETPDKEEEDTPASEHTPETPKRKRKRDKIKRVLRKMKIGGGE